jgi:hypothetical protein
MPTLAFLVMTIPAIGARTITAVAVPLPIDPAADFRLGGRDLRLGRDEITFGADTFLLHPALAVELGSRFAQRRLGDFDAGTRCGRVGTIERE